MIEINNVTIAWEVAFARTYRIMVSRDGIVWGEIHKNSNGFGGTEIIDCRPTTARFVKIEMGQRATEWGNSFWEVSFNDGFTAEP